MFKFTSITSITSIVLLNLATPAGINPVAPNWGALPPVVRNLMPAKVPADFFTGCRPVNGASCEQRYYAARAGQVLLFSERLFAHYLFGNGEVITSFPPAVEKEVRSICSSDVAVRARSRNSIQVSAYGDRHSEEVEYALGSFGCIEEGNTYLIKDTWKYDPPSASDPSEDDLMEGGLTAQHIVKAICVPKGGCKPFPILVRINK